MKYIKKKINTILLKENKESLPKILNWDELLNTTKNDITENIYRTNEFIQDNYWNPVALKDILDDIIEQPKFKIEYKDVNVLYNQLKLIGWGISDVNIKKLSKILKDGNELDPIILNNGKFFDGGHRLTVYKEMGKKMIPTIDIGFMLNFDWEKWENDEMDF